MKKTILLFVMMIALAFTSKAQFSENFDAVADAGMPTGWTLFNVDGLAPATNVNWVTNAWVCYAKAGFAITSKCAWSTSWYTSAGTSNDWMWTPAITVPTTNPVLSYLVAAQDPSYLDGYELRISTAAPTSANLMSSTVLLSVTAAENPAATKYISLAAYAGQTVYIAWRNNSTDMFLLGVDDVVVKSTPNNDAAMVSIDNGTIFGAGSASITGTMKNVGYNNITSYDVTYKIDGGAASAVYTVTGQNIALGGTGTFTHNVPYTFTTGAHTIQVTIGNVNGVADPNQADNVMSKSVTIASQMNPKLCLIEGFSASTCAPCASWNTTFNPWAVTNDANMNFIKYQVNWPGTGDPYYIAQAGDRVTYYGVTGVPDMFHDGVEQTLSTAALDASVAAAVAEKSPFTISGTPTYSGTTVTVPVTINPYVTAAGLTVQVVICEVLTTGNVGTNGETSWHHVMMQMLDASAGTTVSFTDGTPYTHTFTKNMSGTFVESMTNLIAVVFIQDNTTHKVYQSKTLQIALGIGENSIGNVLIYPNPATDNVTIVNALNSNIALYDMVGKFIMSDSKISNSYLLNVADLAKGTYVLKITDGNKSYSRKITVLK
jgi:hypothetical protein